MSVFGKCQGGGRRGAPRGNYPCIIVYRTLLRSDSAVLIDVSSTGARLRGERLPGQGEDLVVNIEGNSTFATVAWSDDGQCGLTFDAPLPAAVLAAIEKKVTRARGLPPQMIAALDDWQGGIAR